MSAGSCPACLDDRHSNCLNRHDCGCCQPQFDVNDLWLEAQQ